MEKYRPIPQEEAIFSQSEACPQSSSYDELWNQEREMQHMDNVQHLHGVYWKGHYWHYGVPQRKRS